MGRLVGTETKGVRFVVVKIQKACYNPFTSSANTHLLSEACVFHYSYT